MKDQHMLHPNDDSDTGAAAPVTTEATSSGSGSGSKPAVMASSSSSGSSSLACRSSSNWRSKKQQKFQRHLASLKGSQTKTATSSAEQPQQQQVEDHANEDEDRATLRTSSTTGTSTTITMTSSTNAASQLLMSRKQHQNQQRSVSRSPSPSPRDRDVVKTSTSSSLEDRSLSERGPGVSSKQSSSSSSAFKLPRRSAHRSRVVLMTNKSKESKDASSKPKAGKDVPSASSNLSDSTSLSLSPSAKVVVAQPPPPPPAVANAGSEMVTSKKKASEKPGKETSAQIESHTMESSITASTSKAAAVEEEVSMAPSASEKGLVETATTDKKDNVDKVIKSSKKEESAVSPVEIEATATTNELNVQQVDENVGRVADLETLLNEQMARQQSLVENHNHLNNDGLCALDTSSSDEVRRSGDMEGNETELLPEKDVVDGSHRTPGILLKENVEKHNNEFIVYDDPPLEEIESEVSVGGFDMRSIHDHPLPDNRIEVDSSEYIDNLGTTSAQQETSWQESNVIFETTDDDGKDDDAGIGFEWPQQIAAARASPVPDLVMASSLEEKKDNDFVEPQDLPPDSSWDTTTNPFPVNRPEARNTTTPSDTASNALNMFDTGSWVGTEARFAEASASKVRLDPDAEHHFVNLMMEEMQTRELTTEEQRMLEEAKRRIRLAEEAQNEEMDIEVDDDAPLIGVVKSSDDELIQQDHNSGLDQRLQKYQSFPGKDDDSDNDTASQNHEEEQDDFDDNMDSEVEYINQEDPDEFDGEDIEKRDPLASGSACVGGLVSFEDVTTFDAASSSAEKRTFDNIVQNDDSNKLDPIEGRNREIFGVDMLPPPPPPPGQPKKKKKKKKRGKAESSSKSTPGRTPGATEAQVDEQEAPVSYPVSSASVVDTRKNVPLLAPPPEEKLKKWEEEKNRGKNYLASIKGNIDQSKSQHTADQMSETDMIGSKDENDDQVEAFTSKEPSQPKEGWSAFHFPSPEEGLSFEGVSYREQNSETEDKTFESQSEIIESVQQEGSLSQTPEAPILPPGENSETTDVVNEETPESEVADATAAPVHDTQIEKKTFVSDLNSVSTSDSLGQILEVSFVEKPKLMAGNLEDTVGADDQLSIVKPDKECNESGAPKSPVNDTHEMTGALEPPLRSCSDAIVVDKLEAAVLSADETPNDRKHSVEAPHPIVENDEEHVAMLEIADSSSEEIPGKSTGYLEDKVPLKSDTQDEDSNDPTAPKAPTLPADNHADNQLTEVAAAPEGYRPSVENETHATGIALEKAAIFVDNGTDEAFGPLAVDPVQSQGEESEDGAVGVEAPAPSTNTVSDGQGSIQQGNSYEAELANALASYEEDGFEVDEDTTMLQGTNYEADLVRAMASSDEEIDAVLQKKSESDLGGTPTASVGDESGEDFLMVQKQILDTVVEDDGRSDKEADVVEQQHSEIGRTETSVPIVEDRSSKETEIDNRKYPESAMEGELTYESFPLNEHLSRAEEEFKAMELQPINSLETNVSSQSHKSAKNVELEDETMVKPHRLELDTCVSPDEDGAELVYLGGSEFERSSSMEDTEDTAAQGIEVDVERDSDKDKEEPSIFVSPRTGKPSPATGGTAMLPTSPESVFANEAMAEKALLASSRAADVFEERFSPEKKPNNTAATVSSVPSAQASNSTLGFQREPIDPNLSDRDIMDWFVSTVLKNPMPSQESEMEDLSEKARSLLSEVQNFHAMCLYIADNVNFVTKVTKAEDVTLNSFESVEILEMMSSSDESVTEFLEHQRPLLKPMGLPDENSKMSPNIIAANYVSFIFMAAKITKVDSPFGDTNPFLENVVESSLHKRNIEFVSNSPQQLMFDHIDGKAELLLSFVYKVKCSCESELFQLGKNVSIDEAVTADSDWRNAASALVGRVTEVAGTNKMNESSRRFIVPKGTDSPFNSCIKDEPKIVAVVLSFLGDPVAVCRMKMINRFCHGLVAENEHQLMQNAVRAGGMDVTVRPAFWMWITLSKCEIPNNRFSFEGKDDLVDIERQGEEGKWHHVIQRDVNRSFGNMPPHKTGARLRNDSIVKALVTWGQSRIMKRGVKGGGEPMPTARIGPKQNRKESSRPTSPTMSSPPWARNEEGDDASTSSHVSETPTDTVSDWSAISPKGSFASYKDGESERFLDKSGSDLSVEAIALSGNGLTPEVKLDLQKKLNFILHSMAVRHEEIGYCQGMDYVVAHLLRILQETIRWNAANGTLPGAISTAKSLTWNEANKPENIDAVYRQIDENLVVEETVIRVMDVFFVDYNLRHMYWPELRCLKTCCRVFERLIQIKLPVLADHMEHHDLNVGLFALGWFQTLFLYLPSMPSETVGRMWDIWLVERSFKIFFRTATAILYLSQPTLLNYELEGMMMYLNTIPDATLLRPDILIPCALNIKVTNRMLEELESSVMAETG